MQHLKVSEEGLHLDRNTLDEGRGRGTVCEVVSRLWGSRQGSTQDREGGSPAPFHLHSVLHFHLGKTRVQGQLVPL